MKIYPLDLRVLVRLDATEKKTPGGIILPDSVSDREKMAEVRGEIVGMGVNAFHEMLPEDRPKVGQRVMIAKYAGIEVSNDNGPVQRIVNDQDILAVID